MTTYQAMTEDELVKHGAAIAAARTKDDFVRALSAYIKEVVERETEPYDKLALFMHGMLEGEHDTAETLTRHVTRVDFESGLDGYRSAFVPACSCGWSSYPYYCSDPVSHETAREEAEEQCTGHRLRVAVDACVERNYAGEHVTRIDPGLDRPSFVAACSCGWSGDPCHWSNLTTGVSEVRAREAAEEQGVVHLRSQGRGGVPS